MKLLRPLGIVLIGIGIYGMTNAEEEQTKPQISDLERISQLKDRFNSDTGKQRLLLLLSPT